MLLLDITLPDRGAYLLAFIVIAVIIWLIRISLRLSAEVSDLKSNNYRATKEYKADLDLLTRNLNLENQNKIKDKEIEHQRLVNEKQSKYTDAWNKQVAEQAQKMEDMRLKYVALTDSRVEDFKKNETSKIQDAALESARVKLQEWTLYNEIRIRREAIDMSKAVILGKVAEHLIPFVQNFPFNHKDVRFIGSPIDLIVFDGYNDEKEDITIYIIEVKTGKSKLSAKQQRIKSAVLKKRIVWQEISLNSLSDKDNTLF